jgi:hypothetical protein
MRLIPAIVALGVVLALAVALWAAADVPLWVGALIGAVAMIANSFVAEVEVGETSGGYNSEQVTERKKLPRIALRVIGGILGLSFIGLGVFALANPLDAGNWWRTYAGPIGMAAMGAVFTYYGLTGRSTVFSGQRDN